MGSPCAPLAPARRAFQLQTAVRRLSPKDPPPLVQGAALGMGRKASFFLFLSQKERSKEKCSLRKGVPPSAEGGRGAAPGPRPPLKRGDGNFTGLRPCWLRLQAVTIALRRVKPPKGAGRARLRGHPGGPWPCWPKLQVLTIKRQPGIFLPWPSFLLSYVSQ